jgi:hypothetical protein
MSCLKTLACFLKRFSTTASEYLTEETYDFELTVPLETIEPPAGL